MKRPRFRAALLAALLFVPSVQAQPKTPPSPTFNESNTVLLEGEQHQPLRFEKAMVVAGEPIATKVGSEILARGGNAVDASIATGFALAVTLPRAGNIGGGGFVLIRDRDNKIYALDFRETAPAKLFRDFYLEPGRSSVDGPSASGVPGTVAGLWEMHRRFGKLPWAELVEPARRLASEGFAISAYESGGIAANRERFSRYASTAEVFLPEGQAPVPGSNFRQPELGETLARIAADGPKDFYHGETARRIAKAMKDSGGVMTAKDLSEYKPVWREPLEAEFHGYRVHSMPPPSSGGLHLLQMLELMEDYPTQAFEHNGARDLHRIAEVMRLAYADRARFLGDPDFVKVPVQRLLSSSYLKEREALINPDKAGDSRSLAPELFEKKPAESFDTTHFNVVDENGMAVSLTYTLNFSFGSGYVASGTGILMNNEMDDFNIKPGEPNSFGLIGGEANKVEARKRPLSSMTPTIVTKDGQFIAAVGAPGGSRIINGVFEWLLNFLAYGYNAQSSSSLPRIHHQWYPDVLRYEVGISPDTRRLLEAKGHKLDKIDAVAHVLAIVRDPDGHLEAGLDPRRPAAAEGY